MKYITNYDFYNDLKNRLGRDADVIIAENLDLEITLFFQEQICDITVFNRDLLPLLREHRNLAPEEILTGLIREIDINKKDVYQIIFNGLMLMYDKHRDKFYLIDISKNLRRDPSDSNADAQNIIGSRDGFTENYKDNIALLRGRLKNSNFLIDEFKIGRRSKTWVGLAYIADIHNDEKRQELINYLNNIDIDAVLTLNDLMAQMSKRTVFPVCSYTGLPDLATMHLLDGEFLLIVDRIPVVLILPTSFASITEEHINLVNNRVLNILHRFIVLFCFLLSTVFLGVFLSFITFQVSSLSLPLLSTLAVTQKGAIFPISLEILFVLFLFELYHLVGFRSSEKTISSTLVLIGGLIIGQNLIDSGMVGVVVITVTALSFLSGFVVSNNIYMVFGISILRLLFIFAALFFGIYGVCLVAILVAVHFTKQSFLGQHLFSPFVPFDFRGFIDYFLARSNKKRITRSNSLDLKDNSMKEQS